MEESDTALAKLTFNSLAAKEVFPDDKARGLRLRIERNGVTFRSAQRRGDDVIAIERRARGVLVSVERAQKRLLDRLYKAGLTEQQPYFVVEPADRGWWSIVHLPSPQAPQRQPLIRVSDFDPRPVPMDLPTWRRFTRAVADGRPVNDNLWLTIRSMVITALAITARPIRGRQSSERLLANKLLDDAQRKYEQIEEWGKGQEDIADEVMQLLARLPEPDDYEDEPEPIEEESEPRPTRKRRSSRDSVDEAPRHRVTDVSTDYVADVLKTDDTRRDRRVVDDDPEPSPRPIRRRRPLIEPVVLDDDEPPAKQSLAESDDGIGEVTFAEVFAEIDQNLSLDEQELDDAVENETDGAPEPTEASAEGEIDLGETSVEDDDDEDETDEDETDEDETDEDGTEAESEEEQQVAAEDEPAETEPQVREVERGADFVDPLVELLGPAEFFEQAQVRSEPEDAEGAESDTSGADEVENAGTPEPNEAEDAESVTDEPGEEHRDPPASDPAETAQEKKHNEPPVGLGDQPDID